MELSVVRIQKPEPVNFILGQSHFIKTVEDIHEALVTAVPGIQFGLAFCEASGPALIRWSGTNDEMIELAKAERPRPLRRPLLYPLPRAKASSRSTYSTSSRPCPKSVASSAPPPTPPR